MHHACCLASIRQRLAQSVEEFYKGRQINLLIGGGAGGGYDVYYRALARHLGKHIPGHPNIIPRTSRRLPGLPPPPTLYTTADKDGATIGAVPEQHSDGPAVRQSGGALRRAQAQLARQHRQAAERLRHLAHEPDQDHPDRRSEREVVVAAAAAPTNTAIMPNVLNALLSTKFKPIIGYDPGAGLTMAIERQEAEGICGLSWSTMKASRPHWISENLLNVIVQMGLDKLPDLPTVPAALDLVTDAEKKQVLDADPDAPGARAARSRPPRRAGRSAGGAAQRFRRHHEGPGLRRRGGEAADGDRAARPQRRSTSSSPLPTPRRSRSCSRRRNCWNRRNRKTVSSSSPLFQLSSPRRRGRQLRIGHGQLRRQLIPPRGEEEAAR